MVIFQQAVKPITRFVFALNMGYMNLTSGHTCSVILQGVCGELAMSIVRIHYHQYITRHNTHTLYIYIIHSTYDYICAAQTGIPLTTTGIELGKALDNCLVVRQSGSDVWGSAVSLQSLKPLLAIDYTDYTQTACCFLKFKMMSFAML